MESTRFQFGQHLDGAIDIHTVRGVGLHTLDQLHDLRAVQGATVAQHFDHVVLSGEIGVMLTEQAIAEYVAITVM